MAGNESMMRTGPNLVLKVAYEDGNEKTIGYASQLTFGVNQGQKAIYTVDSPFPQEIAQAAGPTIVTGSLIVYMLKGTDPLRSGLVVPIGQGSDKPTHALSKYLHWKIYDRASGELAFAIKFVKVGQWSVNVSAKSIVQVQLSFEGIIYEIGTS
jgi:hypothetical protein